MEAQAEDIVIRFFAELLESERGGIETYSGERLGQLATAFEYLGRPDAAAKLRQLLLVRRDTDAELVRKAFDQLTPEVRKEITSRWCLRCFKDGPECSCGNDEQPTQRKGEK